MLAPAIPGALTFKDFNQRSPLVITNPAQNQIDRVVIGFNPWDYATTKDILRIKSLAPDFGSTTLGCNYYDPVERRTEIDSLFDTMKALGYNNELVHKIIRPIRFNTPERPHSGGNHEHLMHFYMEDTAHIGPFLDELFGK